MSSEPNTAPHSNMDLPQESLVDPRVRALLQGRFPRERQRLHWVDGWARRGGQRVAGFLMAGVLLVLQLVLAGMGLESILRSLIGSASSGWVDALDYLEGALCAVGILLISKLRRQLALRGWFFRLRRRA